MTGTTAAEWLRLARPAVWAGGGGAAVLYAVVSTVVALLSAVRGPQGAAGLTRAALEQPSGGTAAVTAAAAFCSVLLLAAFVTATAGDLSRGTWRAALLHQPDPWRLAGSKYVAMLGVVSVQATAALLAGWALAFLVAPSLGIDTGAWLSLDGALGAVRHLGGVLLLAVVWGVVGTALGVLTRSVPVGLGAAILWAGPLENILGDEVPGAAEWFPGLLLQAVLDGGSSTVPGARIALTLGGYVLALVVVTALVLRRRDVTA